MSAGGFSLTATASLAASAKINPNAATGFKAPLTPSPCFRNLLKPPDVRQSICDLALLESLFQFRANTVCFRGIQLFGVPPEVGKGLGQWFFLREPRWEVGTRRHCRRDWHKKVVEGLRERRATQYEVLRYFVLQGSGSRAFD